jgi:GNAT superfamily N-acetyltransferase
MTSPDALRPRTPARDDATIAPVDPPWPQLSRFLYTVVGAPWHWVDRLRWTDAEWLDALSRSGVETWLLTAAGLPAGFFELDDRSGDVEIAYFGLVPRFTGQGLGGHLLTAAVQRAWTLGAHRVWLHTCSLDHPNALANYQARGFRVYDRNTVERLVP